MTTCDTFIPACLFGTDGFVTHSRTFFHIITTTEIVGPIVRCADAHHGITAELHPDAPMADFAISTWSVDDLYGQFEPERSHRCIVGPCWVGDTPCHTWGTATWPGGSTVLAADPFHVLYPNGRPA